MSDEVGQRAVAGTYGGFFLLVLEHIQSLVCGSLSGMNQYLTCTYRCTCTSVRMFVLICSNLCVLQLGCSIFVRNSVSIKAVETRIDIYIYIYYSEALDERHLLVVYTAYTPASW